MWILLQMEHQAKPQSLAVTLNIALCPVVGKVLGENERFSDEQTRVQSSSHVHCGDAGPRVLPIASYSNRQMMRHETGLI